MLELTPLSYGLAIVCLVLLLGRLFIIWRGQLDLFLYLVAVLSTTLWASASFVHFTYSDHESHIASTLDLLRNAAWIGLVFHLLRNTLATTYTALLEKTKTTLALLLSGSLVIATTTFAHDLPTADSIGFAPLIGHILVLISGLLLLMHMLRTDISRALRWLMVAIGVMFGVDTLCYTLAAFTSDNALLESMRALLTAAVSLALFFITPRVAWSKSVCVSHHAANRFVLFLLTLAYLGASGWLIYFVQRQTGQWSALVTTLVSLGAALLFVSVFSSTRRRSQLKVFLNKHFFNYKYDYRDEWLRFIRTLSRGGAGAHLLETVIDALAQIVHSRGGMLWLQADNGAYDLASCKDILAPQLTSEPAGSSLVSFLRQWQWVINLDEYNDDPDLYQDLHLPPWLIDNPKAWLIVPLMQDVELLGFVVIPHPLVKHAINWEDHDLLKTAGRQAATHLAQLMTVQALVEAREFQAFSKLSAFVIHDLKNLVGQLSLVVSNAGKHKHNPAFMEDAIKTVDHSVSKMNRLLSQLKQSRPATQQSKKSDRLSIGAVILDVISERGAQEPRPQLHEESGELFIYANHDRLAAVFEHLIQNAQEATPPDGWVQVRLRRSDGYAIIEISDNGCGMDLLFIRTRLFRPFDSTKGQGGMGIGVYESREYVRELKGDIQVKSTPGEGSIFTISLPLI